MKTLKEYPYFQELSQMLTRYKTDLYLVGGSLRDIYLNNHDVKDFDFAVEKNALKIAKRFSDQIHGAYVLLDDEHLCARVVKKIKGNIFTYDFAQYRAKTIHGDLKKRDFTINTLSMKVTKQSIEKPILKTLKISKDAKNDFDNKVIRRVSEQSIVDDPLRIMRAYSHAAVFGYQIEKETRKQIKLLSNQILNVSNERVRDEFFKILSSARTAKTLRAMEQCGLLTTIMPQLKAMKKCTQGGYHHLDVWKHSLLAIEEFERYIKKCKSDHVLHYVQESIAGNRTRYALIKFALLLHDSGKPDTRKKENANKYSFHGHEKVGKYIARPIAKNFKLSTAERHALENLVFWHLRPGYLSNFKQPSDKAIYRFLRDADEEAVSVLLLSIADQKATRGKLTTQYDQQHHLAICEMLINKYFEKKQEKPLVPIITGNDLIKTLKLEPSPIFKKILDEVYEKQSLGKLVTKNDALNYASNLVKKEKI